MKFKKKNLIKSFMETEGKEGCWGVFTKKDQIKVTTHNIMSNLEVIYEIDLGCEKGDKFQKL